ncbi:MAG: adenosylcobinamide-GDP ribazoletransferase [Huintestinicola sp.]|uniref:adenosylcobinamide-GDP ribazoletransferase n=1 Tax=Huintestinicola sp. TaxID=2981661 RepID=UPI003EFD7D12
MLIKSLISAFSMYSRIPMPHIEWKEENRRYALCFFPFIGAVIGGMLLLWRYIADLLGVGEVLFGAVCTVIPIAVTGGIHLDGFCDVCDAKASYAPREKALEIMSDSHIGAFAAISLGIYLLLECAFFAEVRDFKTMLVIACVFVISRTLSGLAAVTFKCAKKEGALQSFARPAHKNATITVLIIMLILCCGIIVYIDPAAGAGGIIGGLGAFAYYRSFSYKRFGGITGDLAGYFLQVCELVSLICIVIAEKIFMAL